MVVRFLAMRQMSALFRQGLEGFAEWCIPLLVQQLDNQVAKVATTALNILKECAEDRECLEAIIATKCYPTVNKIEGGGLLLLEILSHPSGFRYVSQFW